MKKVQNSARERLESGDLALGVGLRLVRSAEIAKVMKSAGFDWLFIDLEHGAMSLESAAQICVAALDAEIAPIVRVPNEQYSMATRILDNGALGIVIPHVNSAQEAEVVVANLKFPPLGHRSMAGNAPQLDYQPVKASEYAATLNETTLIVVMLETPEAVERCEAIAAVPGVDVLLVGTNDLCAEMGIHGDFGNARVEEAYRRVIAACRKHEKWAGLGGIYDETIAPRYIEMGAKMILAGSDLPFMLSAARTRSNFLRKLPVAR